jgi:quercetin dioxygenase-like cupin family protein
VIEVRNGQPIEHKAGTMVQAGNGVTHWWGNHGTTPVVLVPVDVFKP